ncbi:MAG: hypothetical protein M3362_19200, partial [Acidobacteriota bacterium]|nr:hypothetical protein [Acidobacteriota bacterium]
MKERHLKTDFFRFSIHRSSFCVQRFSLLVWLVLALLTLLFVSAIFIAPVAEAHGHGSIALLIYASFGKFCHQI